MIAIPDRLLGALSQNSGLLTYVNNSVYIFSEWIERNRLTFFPEYTDHGPKHIEDVLVTSTQLIAEPAFTVLTPEDAAVIILATVLHDCGMHLTQDGFIRLVTGRSTLKPVAGFDTATWPQLWESFGAEVKHFSQVDNERMFGDPRPVLVPMLDDWKKWTNEQQWMIGEFVRRHHPRLAHEAALAGFPGSESEALRLDDRLGPELRDLIGLVARSHGMDLRLCIDYLDHRWREHVHPENAHAVFAMAVLRIADYLQIDAPRAPGIQIRMQALRSQLSIREWKKHHAIPILSADLDDAEARKAKLREREVDSIDTFLSLRRLLTDIQRELDSSWAVLGEVFSRYTQADLPLYKLGMTVRRLRSSLDEREFLDGLPFEPEGPRFRSADSKLFDLLIEPLYGDNTDAGVRELVQNSIDAVRELEAWRAHHPGEDAATDPALQADVEVDLVEESGATWLRVRDRGIGMNLAIVRDYYLTVGASYRQSADWKKEFTGPDQKSTILRTGYFGIGALAGFLIGDEIRVRTRRAGAKTGLQFTASLYKDAIQMNRVACPAGTTIEIPVRKDLLERAWGFAWSPSFTYLLKKPSIRVLGRVLEGSFPDSADQPGPEWQRLAGTGAPEVFWARKRRFDARVVHNGFMIEHADRDLRQLWANRSRLRVLLPNLHILDREGNAPKPYLDLSRSKFLQERFEPLQRIYVDVLRDYMAFLLATIADSPAGNRKHYAYPYVECVLANQHPEPAPHSYIHIPRCNPIVYTARGVAPLDAGVLAELGVRSLFLLNRNASVDVQALMDGGACGILPFDLVYQEADALLYGESASGAPGGLNIGWSRVLFSRAVSNDRRKSVAYCLAEEGAVRKEDGGLNDRAVARSAFGISKKILRVEDGPRPNEESIAIEWGLNLPEHPARGEASLDEVAASFHDQSAASPLALAWRHFLGDWLIPYSAADREKKFARAFAGLTPYIAAWRQIEESEKKG